MNRRDVLSGLCSVLLGLVGMLLYAAVLTNGRFW
jgi:hypothetical protein